MAQNKRINYKPNIIALAKKASTAAAKDVVKIEKILVEKKVRHMVIRGKSYDQISAKLGISVEEALKATKNITQRWLVDEAIDAANLRELELKRLDALFELAMFEAFPHPVKDSVGQTIMVRKCDCSDDPDDQSKPCIFEEHNTPAMTGANKDWADFAMKVGQRRAALLGLDAADKLESKKADLLERIYRGVDAKVIDQL